uniref:Uncharacterized protein n=1 Tax=Ananas comosus var. bracteatus TaxID=296719 RepID=A0A6V7Q1G4_ANACO|nr:unnamed protein product [Ananas comosus var. bracteatus]
MGNCFALEEREVIKIMRVDGKILQYKPPMKVHQALEEFPNHAISDSFSTVRYLNPSTNMRGGRPYYLLPLKKTPITEAVFEDGVIRIKLVITKQALKDMLRKEIISLDDVISLCQRESRETAKSDEKGCAGWQPALQSIPEGNDFL